MGVDLEDRESVLAKPSDDGQTPVAHQMAAFQLLRAIGQSLEPQTVASIAVETMAELTNWSLISLVLPDLHGRYVVVASTDPTAIGWTEGGLDRSSGTGPLVVRSRINDVSQSGSRSPMETISVPISRGEQHLGALIVGVEPPSLLEPADLQLAQSLAEVIALALDNARLYEESQRRLQAQLALQQASVSIASELDLPSVLNRIAEQMCLAIDATSAYICSYESESAQSEILAEYFGPRAIEQERVSDLGVTYHLPHDFPGNLNFLKQGLPSVDHVDDVGYLSDAERAHMIEYGAQSTLAIPLQVGGKTMAFAELWESWYRREFTAEEIQLCQGIAQQAALAIENARLFQNEREQHGRLQALIDSTSEGVILVGLDGRILVANCLALKLLQLKGSPESWTGRKVSDVLLSLRRTSPEAVSATLREIRRLAAGNFDQEQGDFQIGPKVMRWRSVPVMNGGEMPIGRLLILHDVSEQKVLAKMRNDLTHAMMHDIRESLTAVSSSLDLLHASGTGVKFEHKRDKVLSRAREGSRRILSLVYDIIDVSQLETGKLSLDYRPISLANLIHDILGTQLSAAKEKGLTLENNVPLTAPSVWCDERLVRRAIQNLIKNAQHFTPKGGVIRISAQTDPLEASMLRISVNDSGPGNPAEAQASLFHKLAPDAGNEDDSGLGLYFSKLVIEAHGGRIWLGSSAEGSATFHFNLPLQKPPATA